MSQKCLNSELGSVFQEPAGPDRLDGDGGGEEDSYTLTLLLHFDSSPVQTQGTVSLGAQIFFWVHVDGLSS